jgi:hypothetical protein
VSDHYRKFATIYFARSFVLVFCRWHIIATQKEIAYIIMDKKIERRCGIDAPLARLRAWLLLPAAESFYVTEVRKFPVVSLIALRLAAQQIETAVRSWRLITAACDASAVRRRRRLWRLCPASNRGCLSYLDQDFVFR